MTLASTFDVRRNAVAFLRVAFSLIVIFGHAWEVGGFGPDPLKAHCNVTPGQLGVHAFFVIGGFLVTGSYLNAGSWRHYLTNRALRILPGYWFCLVLTGAVLFPFAAFIVLPSASPPVDGAVPFATYIARNFCLRIRQPVIGDLFATHPVAGLANGALWSIFPEAICYVALAVAGIVGVLRSGRRVWLIAAFAVAAGFFAATDTILGALATSLWRPSAWYLLQLAGLGACFAGGALCWTYGAALRFSPAVRYAALAMLTTVIAAGAYRWLGPLFLPPAVLALATLIPWRNFDRFGDFSYGLYLYHCPVQQILYGLQWGNSSPIAFLTLTLAVTFPLAALSWFAIEKPALRLKRKPLHRP